VVRVQYVPSVAQAPPGPKLLERSPKRAHTGGVDGQARFGGLSDRHDGGADGSPSDGVDPAARPIYAQTVLAEEGLDILRGGDGLHGGDFDAFTYNRG
jgi:hypothetical protein